MSISMAKEVATRRDLLQRWRRIEEEEGDADDDDDPTRLHLHKEKWFPLSLTHISILFIS